ncbi:MAG: hypothetical protein ACYC1Y_02615 [Minisyncoccota bacterium]
MDWPSGVSDNLLPLSREQHNLNVALTEWEYRGNLYDTESPSEICQLCNHPEIRYQFEIVNKYTESSLLVGSECIKKFDNISVLDEDGIPLEKSFAKKKLDRDRRKLITSAQTKSLINSLIELGRKDQDFDISSFEQDYKERGFFTPRQLALLVWRLDKHKVPFKKSYFNTQIKRTKDKDALLGLKDFQKKNIWECLSDSQKEFLNRSREID